MNFIPARLSGIGFLPRSRNLQSIASGLSSTPPLAKESSLFATVGDIPIEAFGERGTNFCFKVSRPIHRFGTVLPSIQPKTEACIVTVLSSRKRATLGEWAESLVQEKDLDAVALGTTLKKNGFSITLVQAEKIAQAMEDAGGKKEMLFLQQKGFFFFVETGIEESPIAVCCIERKSRFVWIPRIYSLQERFHFRESNCLVVPNFGVMKT